MHIYTRLGDHGDTSLYTPKGVPQRLSKADARVEAYGTIDELNSVLGVVRSELAADDPLQQVLAHLQNRLFHAGYDISTMPQADGPPQTIKHADTERLEQEIDRLQGLLPPLQNFVLPSGVKAATYLQQARTIARRAERRVVAAGREQEFNPEVVAFLNRMSDLLFVLARYVNLQAGGQDEAVDWQV